MASNSRISGVAPNTSTRRGVIQNRTLGVCSASSWARVHAFIVVTRSVPRTIVIDDTFRFAACVRVSKVFRQASARSCSVTLFANGVGATRWRVAWVARFFLSYFDQASDKRISCVSWFALAIRGVFDDEACSVRTTRSGAGVFAHLVQTGQISRTFFVHGAFRSAIGWPADVVW